jgi:hypothetical protein
MGRSVTPERWRRIEEIFTAAIALAPIERASYLRTACAEDVELAGEIEALLASSEQAHEALEDTVGRSAAALVEREE